MPDGFRNGFLPRKNARALAALPKVRLRGGLGLGRQRFIQVLVQPVFGVLAIHRSA